MTSPPALQLVDRNFLKLHGRRLVFFGGCDYFRLASHPKVLAAVARGVRQFGLNVAASRTTTGNHALYETLEKALGKFFGAESAVLLSSGYVAGMAVAQALAGRFTHVLIDERSHGCLRDAAQMFGVSVLPFSHRDVFSLKRALHCCGRRARPVLLTDGMFSHDGSIAPVREYLKMLPKDGLVVLDDAHGAGTLGAQGRGTLEIEGVDRRRVIQTITLSKAFGVYGGAALGSRELRETIRSRSRLYIGNTPMPLPLAQAALVAVEIMTSNRTMRRRLGTNVARVKNALIKAGYPVLPTPGPIVPFLPENPNEAARFSRELLRRGIYPPFIRYPGSPQGGYFRFVISSEHTFDQLDLLVELLAKRALARDLVDSKHRVNRQKNQNRRKTA